MTFKKTQNNSAEEALSIMEHKKVALFILTYNAQKYIKRTISRIPKELVDKFASIYLIDDYSSDETFQESIDCASSLGLKNFIAMRTPFNQGYGGNQKIGYTYAIEQGFDIVIMLHGDGQYPPEFLPDIIAGFKDDQISAVFGSRMIHRYQALKGGMPLYKWFGNQILTTFENKLLGSNLFEFHSGYRAYSISAVKSIPYLRNSDNFHFDTDIIIQLIAKNLKIKEVAMPTYYGDEKCHVDGLKYAFNCIKSVIKFRLHKMGIFYQPNFDIEQSDMRNYDLKSHKNTLHHFVQQEKWEKSNIVADIGANDGRLSCSIAEKVKEITAVDIKKPDFTKENVAPMEIDLNGNFDLILGNQKFDKVIALDIIEHLNNPEEAVKKINNILKNNGTLYASTANIAYIIMRMTLAVGWFNYGKRGILDKTHHRLFTVNSFKRLLKNSGFKIKKIIGFGPPIADQISNKGIFGILDTIASKLARIWPSLFSFNYLIIATKKINFSETYNITTKKISTRT